MVPGAESNIQLFSPSNSYHFRRRVNVTNCSSEASSRKQQKKPRMIPELINALSKESSTSEAMEEQSIKISSF